ncbi:MAG: hypothetical protein A4E53_00940 [Pelotomaculum sp. PtaB.Bin104]|nr:MAG: hypothetical protein A4E53_00940 [Pelotomaculum sp. PtaB.Bin104]
MKRMLILFMLLMTLTGLVLLGAGCSALPGADTAATKFTEQDVRNALTELINGINSGDVKAVEKYVGEVGPVAETLVEKLKGQIKLSNIRDVTIEGTQAKATVTLEVVPLKITKDVNLTLDATDVLLLNSPLGLLSILL